MEAQMMLPRQSCRWNRIIVRGVAGLMLLGAGVACQETQLTTPGSQGVAATETGVADPRSLFVGTWRLLRVERYDHRGVRLPAAEPGTFGAGDPLGYLMYDGFHMGVVIQQEGRVAYAVNQQTPDGALAAVTSYVSYFGPYSVNEEDGYVTHHVLGSLNPRRIGAEYRRYYELSGTQLILMPPLSCPDSFVTDSGCGYGTTGIQLRIVWEKVAPQRDVTVGERKLFGFWVIDSVQQKTLQGEPVTTVEFTDGYLTYMPSGYMSVHLMQPDRPPYEGIRPTADEAEAAMRTYVSYAGPFTVQADDGYVLHHRVANLRPNGIGFDAQWFYEFLDDQLILMPPVRTVEGHQAQSYIHWNRISTLEE